MRGHDVGAGGFAQVFADLAGFAAQSASAADWFVRGGLTNVNPKSNNGTVAGNAATIDSNTQLGLSFGYHLNPNVANRNAGPKKKPEKNRITADQAEVLKAALQKLMLAGNRLQEGCWLLLIEPAAGSEVLVLSGIDNSSNRTIYVQGTGVGSTTVTAMPSGASSACSASDRPSTANLVAGSAPRLDTT